MESTASAVTANAVATSTVTANAVAASAVTANAVAANTIATLRRTARAQFVSEIDYSHQR